MNRQAGREAGRYSSKKEPGNIYRAFRLSEVMVLPVTSLLLLSFALAWAVVFDGGVRPHDWYTTLLTLGCSSSAYWVFTRRIDRAPPLQTWLRCLIVLLPCYIIFQLVPFPIEVLRILSPARSDLLRALLPIVPGVTSAPLSVNPPAAVLNLFAILGYTATFLLVRELSWRLSARPWILAIPLIVIAAFEAGLGMFQVFANWPSGSATGTYVNYDHFAGFLEMILPFAIVCGLAILRNKNFSTFSAIAACALWAIAALQLLAIFYSLSRAGFLATLFVLFTVGALSIGRRIPSRAWRGALLGTIGSAIVLIMIFLPPNQLIQRFAAISPNENMSADSRLLLWKETLPVISEYRMFGCGLGGFESVFLKHQTVEVSSIAEFAHNDYLQYLAELGAVGFIIFAGILTGILFQILRGIVGLVDEERRLLVIACAATFVGILLHSFVDFNMYIPANAMTLAWIAGIGSANALD
ncbi:MAG: O-antigen ligase family protein [Bryobacteraceae bacterium]